MKILTFSLVLASLIGSIDNVNGQTKSGEYLASIAGPATNNRLTVPANKPGTDEESLSAARIETIRSADFIEFGSVGFYPNATIMHASFKSEMLSLASYMKENPDFRLIIHGHCHGNAKRTTITLGTSDNFFNMNCENQIRAMSAMELSELRAESARLFLISQGINAERIQIVAEAGNAMIYPLTSLHAEYNDRIEFEILRH